MKRTLCLLLTIVLITALFAGCAPAVPETSGTTAPTTIPTQPTDPEPTDPAPTDPDPTDPAQPTDPTDPTDPEPTDPPSDQPKEFDVQILNVGGPRDERVCAIALRSTADLQAYCQQYAPNLEKNFQEEISVYDDAFFADHTLIVLALHEGTTSNTHQVTQVIEQADGNYVVYIDRTIPAIQTDLESFWHILIAIEGCSAEDAQVAVEENDIYLPMPW